MNNKNLQSGEMNALLIPLILAIILAVGFMGFGGWAYLSYIDARDNLQSKIDIAVAEGKKVQQEEDNKVFAEREKEPYKDFVGPSDLGSLKFKYPKTWSVYIAEDGTGGQYMALFQPGIVPPLDSGLPYAVRAEIIPDNYESVLSNYQNEVENGDLRSEPVTINGFNGIRLSGAFSDNIPNAQMVLFKIRDKTLQLSTEAPQYFDDFRIIVLKSLNFNP